MKATGDRTSCSAGAAKIRGFLSSAIRLGFVREPVAHGPFARLDLGFRLFLFGLLGFAVPVLLAVCHGVALWLSRMEPCCFAALPEYSTAAIGRPPVLSACTR